jgi:hypothetical protein
MSAGIQFSGYLGGHSQNVWFTYGWPSKWAVNWSVHSWAYPPTGSPARMGLVLPVGAESQDYTTQTYFLLIQNAGDTDSYFDAVFQFEQF